ncbi:MAG TPA: hypothetical protein DC011_01360, partial [Bacteroidetes bacterium]|nr:hypothetical protein [Bacteroidota bacterium]
MKKFLTLPHALRVVGVLIVGAVLLTSTGMIPIDSQATKDATQIAFDSMATGADATAAIVVDSSGSTSNSIVGTWVSIVPPLLAIGFAL